MKGIIQGISTRPGGVVRFLFDVPVELAPNDMKAWLYQYAELTTGHAAAEENDKRKRKGKTHGKKDRAGSAGIKKKGKR